MTAPRLTRPASAPAPKPGIVHLGLGAFFRAFGALYVQEAMAKSGGDWGIVGVSMRRPDQRDLLVPQGCVYHAVELAQCRTEARLITALTDVLVAPEDPAAVLDALDHARIVTLTVTEKGYCHSPATGRLDFTHPDIVQDLSDPGRPASAIGYICRALAARQKAGARAFTIMSCDNIPENGRLLRGLVLELADRIDPALARWIAVNAAFPSTMVDRIVPATTPDDIAVVAELTGTHDAAPVMHEPFRQWVIEDHFVGGERPDFGGVGVELVSDVTPFEHMKLRCLNGTHSALAYLGYLSGAETIADAVSRPELAGFVKHLWREEIIPVLTPPPGTDLTTYSDALFQRYSNPSIRHRTWQIAMDGSQKLPQRILGTIAENFAADRDPAGLCLGVAAWMKYTCGIDELGQPIEVRDPLADALKACWRDPALEVVVDRYLDLGQVFPRDLARQPRFRATLVAALSSLMEKGALASAAAIIER